MKLGKITSVILALCMLAALMVMPVSAAKAELPEIVDSSFEEWGATGMNTMWTHGGRTGLCPATTTSEKAYSGSYSFKMADYPGNTERHRSYITQNVGQIPTGANIVLTARVYIAKLTDTGAGVRLIGRYGSVDGDAPFNTAWQTTATNEWVTLSCQATNNSTKDLYITVDVNSSAGYEVYVDDFTLSYVKPEIADGDFENGAASWAFKNTSASEAIVTENNNSYLNLTVNRSYINKTVKNLMPGVTYRISFDICSNGGYGYIDTLGTPVYFSNRNTNGAWERLYYTWTQGETNTRAIRFMFINDGAVEGAYTKYDNIVIEEVEETDNYFVNGGFEYGAGGLMGWTASGSATFTQVDGGFEGMRALKVNKTAAADGKLQQAVALPESDKLEYYEISAYVKNISISEVSDAHAQIIFRPNDYQGEHDSTAFEPAPGRMAIKELPANEWVRLRSVKRIAAGTKSDSVQFLLRNFTGEVLIDNVSYRKLDTPVFSFEKTNGAYTDKMANGVKASFYMPATEAEMVVLAVYKRTDNVISIADIQVEAITDADITKGYKEISLSSTSLEDFENENYYAKLMILKNGTLSPVMDDILLTK